MTRLWWSEVPIKAHQNFATRIVDEIPAYPVASVTSTYTSVLAWWGSWCFGWSSCWGSTYQKHIGLGVTFGDHWPLCKKKICQHSNFCGDCQRLEWIGYCWIDQGLSPAAWQRLYWFQRRWWCKHCKNCSCLSINDDVLLLIIELSIFLTNRY